MSKRSLASASGGVWVSVLLLITTCYSLKCRTDDGPSESELKRITRNCMRKIGEKAYPNNGGLTGSYNNNKHYGPLHQSNFGTQYKSNSRYDYNYDYDDDNDNYNGNGNNNYNSNNNNYNNNGNYDRESGDRNVLQHRGRQQTNQNNRADNNDNRSASSGNNGGRYENGNGHGSGGGGGNGGGGNGGGSGNSNSGGRNSGSSGSGAGNSQRGKTQNTSHKNNNNNNNNNQSSNNDTADVACVVHCFFEEMNMLDSHDYPDRYKVQYGLTRELRDRELRNFYTDTIQDCFHYLESQRRRDKCHYSRDLIHCMSEYAKVNCDDWQEFSVVFN